MVGLEEKTTDVSTILKAYRVISRVFKNLDQPDKALDYTKKAIALAQKEGEKEEFLLLLGNAAGLLWPFIRAYTRTTLFR